MKKFLSAAAVAALGLAALPAAAQQTKTGTPCPAGQERMASGACEVTGSNASENLLGNNPKGGTDSATTGSGAAAAGSSTGAKRTPDPSGMAPGISGGGSGSGGGTGEDTNLRPGTTTNN